MATDLRNGGRSPFPPSPSQPLRQPPAGNTSTSGSTSAASSPPCTFAPPSDCNGHGSKQGCVCVCESGYATDYTVSMELLCMVADFWLSFFKGMQGTSPHVSYQFQPHVDVHSCCVLTSPAFHLLAVNELCITCPSPKLCCAAEPAQHPVVLACSSQPYQQHVWRQRCGPGGCWGCCVQRYQHARIIT
jgi:hypothetical protein